MAIGFHPKPGAILLCDYSGFKVPEMVKRRPAIVLSPRLRHRDGLCTVVPLSGTTSNTIEDYHCRIAFDRPLPKPWGSSAYWAKADMLATVGFHRLHMIGIGRDQAGRRKYMTSHIKPDDLRRIRVCVLHALGLSRLTTYL